ncbi:transthyretin-like family protein [Paludisphaera rhizosphaerae]|uniref:hypothetical protein n=1 Tax=Paludisphaera rhizosphaerae TaxID=2711216 RepID=UPI0013EDD6B2|nr:hypothetical protein [Paludisphaera rhizosphaerae]
MRLSDGTTPKRRVVLDARSVHAVLLAGLVGCGGSGQATVYPVAGTLTVNGQPAANAMIAFHPLDRAGSPAVLSVASTGPDGAYRLTTYTAGDGAPAGEYAVTIVWPDDSKPWDECEEDLVTHDRFQGRYADPTRSPWRVIVRPGANEAPLRAAPPDESRPLP